MDELDNFGTDRILYPFFCEQTPLIDIVKRNQKEQEKKEEQCPLTVTATVELLPEGAS